MEYKKSKFPHKFSHQNFDQIKGVRVEVKEREFNLSQTSYEFPNAFLFTIKPIGDFCKGGGRLTTLTFILKYFRKG